LSIDPRAFGPSNYTLSRQEIRAMNEFAKSTFTRQKFQGLFVNTALGNFAGYVAGSLVTLVSTYHSAERRAIRNLFGILPRKKIVVHLLPEWLEWLLALIVGFLVMELVRYWINQKKYAAFLTTVRREQTAQNGRCGEAAAAGDSAGAVKSS
jgi:hypothetical protein